MAGSLIWIFVLLMLAAGPAAAQMDVVFAAVNSNPQRVCLNDGFGGLTCSELDIGANSASAVALGDLDGVDGPDLVFGRHENGPSRVCLNDGAGGFTCSDLTPGLHATFGLALADLDGVDGLDVVLANDGEANRVCLNDGTGSFTCSAVSGDANESQSVALADLDGVDGPDAVFANSGERNRVCLNDGTGSFTCSDVATDANETSAVALADLDGVNGPDAVFSNLEQRNRVCLNDGTGSFTCSDLDAVSRRSTGVALADLDGVDGPDLVFANLLQRHRVCLNDGTGAFACSDLSADTGLFLDVVLADFDGVGGVDAVFVGNGNRSRLCRNDGTGSFTCSDLTPVVDLNSGVAVGFLRPADLAITKSDDRTTAVPGESVTYAISVTNSGPFSSAATVSDPFPPELSCTWTCTGSGGGDCTAGPVGGDLLDVAGLPPGASVTYSAQCAVDPGATGAVVNTATVSGPPGQVDPDLADRSATDIDVITPQADLGITNTDKQATAAPGSTVAYIVSATNAGPIGVSGATVTDDFPAVLSCDWTCVTTGGASCTAAGSGDIAESVDLPAGASATFVALCAIDPSATGTVVNTAKVSPPAGVTDPVAANDSATDVDALVPQADLTITKDDGQSTAVPGETTTYSIFVRNPAGPSDAPGTLVTDVFSSLLSCTWTCATSPGTTPPCTLDPHAGDINRVVNLPVGGVIFFEAVCEVDPGATGTVTNTATVTAAPGIVDPVAGNDSATDVDTLTPQADLAITKDDGVTVALPGDVLTYTIVAANPGPSDALAVTVEDLFPPELIDCEWTCAPAGGALCTSGPVGGDLADSADLFAGSSATYTATCTVDPDADFPAIANTATITEPAGVTDPEPGDNAATDVDLGNIVFADGFESGDTTSWSESTP